MTSKNNLLLDEHPLVILPNLAKLIGLNEAVVLQQIHYWLETNKQNDNNFREGRYWSFNSYEQWKKQFPFWSISTIRRAIAKLESTGLLISSTYNQHNYDKTKWYSIDYEKISGMSKGLFQNEQTDLLNPSVQNEQTICSKWTDVTVQNEQTNTRDYTETTTEKNKSNIVGPPEKKETKDRLPNGFCNEVIEYLNSKAGTKYKYTAGNTVKLISTRYHEGFTIEDFKAVIDHKVAEWKDNEKMKPYLRPATLFSGKMDWYVSQAAKPKRAVRKTYM